MHAATDMGRGAIEQTATSSHLHSPLSAEQFYVMGAQHKAREEFVEAETCYRESLRLRPGYVDVWVSLGVLVRKLGRFDEAETCQREALRLDPANFIATLNLGNALYDQGRYDEAQSFYRQAVDRNPNSAEAHNNLGRTLWEFREASAGLHFLRALELKPDYFEAAEGLGKCLYQCDRYMEAAAALTTASKLRPDDVNTRLNLASALMVARKFEQALAHYEHLLQLDSNMSSALAGMAAVLSRRGQYTKPRALFEQALALAPDDVWVQANYAQMLLRAGDFAQGWEYYEFRWRSDEFRDALNRLFIEPTWMGESLAGKSLLIISEQGLGDELMFASMYPELMREAEHCIIECDIRLQTLFRRSFPGATVFGVKKKGNEKNWSRLLEQHLHELPRFDCWIPLGSLSRFRRRSRDRFPKHQGYLQTDVDARRRWAARLGELGPGLKIGISWRGGTAGTSASVRTLTLQQLAPILTDKKCRFVNLQYGDCASDLADFAAATGATIHHWQEAIDDYDETAALVSELDLVITVCTALVHLCGALGRPAWVMAPFVAEWRYGREGQEMIWYPSIRVFRQSKLDQWTPVIAEVRRALHKLLQSGGRA